MVLDRFTPRVLADPINRLAWSGGGHHFRELAGGSALGIQPAFRTLGSGRNPDCGWFDWGGGLSVPVAVEKASSRRRVGLADVSGVSGWLFLRRCNR